MFIIRESDRSMIYGLVRCNNQGNIDAVSTSVHYDIFPVTMSGTDRNISEVQTKVSTVAPTDLPTSIVIGNSLRTIAMAHAGDHLDGWLAGSHKAATLAADTTFITLCNTVIVDLTTLDAFLVGFKTWGAAHAASTTVHANADSGAWVAALAGGTIATNSVIATAITFIALAVTFLNSHVGAAITSVIGHQIRIVGP